MDKVSTKQIVQLSQNQIKPAAQFLAKAFQDDPLYSYSIPDATKRAKVLRWLMEKVILYTTRYGEANVTSGLEGIACWLLPGQTDLTVPRIIRTGFHNIVFHFGWSAYKRFDENISYAGKLHKKLMEKPHWYLWAIGVDPDHRGKGIGGSLLRPVLTSAVSTGTPCFLETHKESNVRFYEKHGFKVVQKGKAPGHDIRVWMMATD